MTPEFPDVDAYLAAQPPKARATLAKIRALARKAAPKGEERISYRMPARFVNGRALVYFAAFKSHVGIFPPARGDAGFMKAIAPYAGPKGNLAFPHDQAFPAALIERFLRVRLEAVADPATTKVNAKASRRVSAKAPGKNASPKTSPKAARKTAKKPPRPKPAPPRESRPR
jgi:uncharacterized protein YdhG (YjbR/CyaY superfamily)